MSGCKGSHKKALAGVIIVLLIIVGCYFGYKSIHNNQDQPSQEPNSVAPTKSTSTFTTQQQQSTQSAAEPSSVAPTSTTIAVEQPLRPSEESSPASAAPSTDGRQQQQQQQQHQPEVESAVQSELANSGSSSPPLTQHQQQQQQPPQQAELPVQQADIAARLPPTNQELPADVDLEFPVNFSDRTESELEAWRTFRRSYNKNYPTRDEQLKRQAIFLANLRYINGFNSRKDTLFTLDVNHFADFTRDEINGRFIGPSISWQQVIQQLQLIVPPELNVLKESSIEAQSIDWRNITAEPVDQGNCMESSVFAVIALLESALNNQMMGLNPNITPVKLSEGQILDCLANSNLATQNGPPVCAGFTSVAHILNLIQHRQIGLMTRQSYEQLIRSLQPAPQPVPFCHSNPPGSEPSQLPHLTNYMLVQKNNIAEAIFKMPLAVALDASQSSFHFYKSGLYHDDNCSQESFNHHALLVGYSSSGSAESLPIGNTADQQQAHFIIRNSFGPKWGESGYMRLLKDEQRNKCLPQNFAVYPNLQLAGAQQANLPEAPLSSQVSSI